MAVSGTFTTTGQASPAIEITKANLDIADLVGTITVEKLVDFAGTPTWVACEVYTADVGNEVLEPAGPITVRLVATTITSGTAKWSIGT